jgi:hypothetical protein
VFVMMPCCVSSGIYHADNDSRIVVDNDNETDNFDLLKLVCV